MMASHGADPAFLGTQGGNNHMKLVTMVTLHWQEGGHRVVSKGMRLKEGNN